MDESAAGTSLCSALHRDNKVKYKENTFTAKVESGTLKVKILRQDQKPVDNGVDTLSSTTSTKTRKRRATRQPQLISDSPPKPRPNRKHVPIFYEPQFRQLIKQRGGHSSSMDDSMRTRATSSTEESAASGTTKSTSSTTSKSVSQLPDVRFYTKNKKGVDLPPKMNQLLVRNDTEGQEVLSELLRSYFPSSGSSGLHSLPVGGTQPAETSSCAGQLEDQTIGLTSALHQLASSSALYRSALNELSTGARVQPSTLSSAGEHAAASNISASSTITTTLAKTSDTTHSRTNEGMKNYWFDPLSALQTAIDHARRASSACQSVNQQNDKHRESESTNSSARVYRLEPSNFYATTHNNGNTSTETRLGALPDFSPSLTVQNSLLGGGIQHPSYSKFPVNVEGNNVSDMADSTKATVTALGPPPDAIPSFLLQNSLTGGSMSMLDLPRTHPSLDRPGSLTSLINLGNETAKDLNSVPKFGLKTHLSLDRRLVSITSSASEDSGSGKSMSMTASCPTSDTSSTSSHTIQDTVSNGAVDLGPPPSSPPAFTIGNSLMGGGIELQPAAANVNTHNFDWKLHRAVPNTSEDATFSSEISREISYALRARLERSLISSENILDKA
ncbi:unnamed protein product [Peronospora farinosa]|uniref:Uncharacterized protein n=1 Tax=Peronospora farinosa TaxID=134698 RepID=A0ABN8C539_9STRA|nr:unnamed protein product [Peronospora farinosa]